MPAAVSVKLSVPETAGLPATQYQQYLSRLSETLPVVTANVCIDSDGNYYAIAEKDESPYADLLDQYWRFQYNHMFDQANYPEEFYTLEIETDTGRPLSAQKGKTSN